MHMTTQQEHNPTNLAISNLRKKRSAGKANSDFKLSDAYKIFTQNSDDVVTWDKYKRICIKFNEFVVNELLFKGRDFTIPFIGSLSIRKRKIDPKYVDGKLVIPKLLPIDYKATMIYRAKHPEDSKKVIYQLNKHTDGYRYFISWDKRAVDLLNQSVYVFKFTRTHSRALAALLKDKHRDIDFSLINSTRYDNR